ncbi:MAG: hypothetical protein V2A76_17325 [Planctomycetota bacterium]
MIHHLVALLVFATQFNSAPAATDWVSMGTDCACVSAGDVDGDGFADVITINGNRDLCMAPAVGGFKAAGWIAVASSIPAGEVGILCDDFLPANPGLEVAILYADHAELRSGFNEGRLTTNKRIDAPSGSTLSVPVSGANAAHVRTGDGALLRLTAEGFEPAEEAEVALHPVSPPPYEPAAPPLITFRADVTGEGIPDTLTAFTCKRPHAHVVVRMAPGPAAGSGDMDTDGLSDDEEREIGTDPLDRDTDADGLLDGWEVHGLPRGVELGDRIGLFQKGASAADSEARLDPRRQDVLLLVSLFEGVDPAAFDAEIPQIQKLFRDLDSTNRDGSRGLRVHFRIDPARIPKDEQAKPWWDLGNARLPARERGLFHWMQVTPWGGGQSSETGDMGGAGFGHDVFAHEFGHQLSLSHTGDSAPAWCPLYTSLMSYAFSYGFDGDHAKIHFSDGRFRGADLNEAGLEEHLAYPYAQLAYLAKGPYRFTLADAGDGTTLIDWNHNGKFDAGLVQADINYGGSTYCGIRREHEAIGSAPSLAYVGDTCFLLAADQTRDHLWLKSCEGGEQWSEKRLIANSGTEREPVLVGGPDHGLVFHHHLYGWHVTRFDAKSVGAPVKIPDLPAYDLNACPVGDRVLLVSRRDDNQLEARWLSFENGDPAAPRVTSAQTMETRSLVTPGLAVDPGDGRLLLVTSMDNSHGAVYCMRVTRARIQGDRLWEQETLWTRGEASGNGCCSRPVVAFNGDGQLTIFHQGGPDAAGQMIAYRTSRVGSLELDEGWLTCMLYDVWTRSRVPVGFASGPQGAIFAYRWDAGGEHINWLATAHCGFGIDTEPMRDFNDGEKVSRWGIRHSILNMRAD